MGSKCWKGSQRESEDSAGNGEACDSLQRGESDSTGISKGWNGLQREQAV
jgi:hypothetical protein